MRPGVIAPAFKDDNKRRTSIKAAGLCGTVCQERDSHRQWLWRLILSTPDGRKKGMKRKGARAQRRSSANRNQSLKTLNSRRGAENAAKFFLLFYSATSALSAR
jgi:hypothetical protein